MRGFTWEQILIEPKPRDRRVRSARALSSWKGLSWPYWPTHKGTCLELTSRGGLRALVIGQRWPLAPAAAAEATRHDGPASFWLLLAGRLLLIFARRLFETAVCQNIRWGCQPANHQRPCRVISYRGEKNADRRSVQGSTDGSVLTHSLNISSSADLRDDSPTKKYKSASSTNSELGEVFYRPYSSVSQSGWRTPNVGLRVVTGRCKTWGRVYY